MGIAYNTSIVRDGLVLHLDAANPKSYPGTGTAWKDLSGNGNDGTLVNGVTYAEDNSGSMVFDGINDYVSLGDVYDNGSEPISINLWFIFDTSGSIFLPIIVNKDGTGSNRIFIGTDGASLAFRTEGSSFGVTYFSSLVPSLGSSKWNNICLTRNGTNVILWINGEILVSASDTPSDDIGNTNWLVMGRTSPSSYSSGNVSSLTIYNKALSEEEVKQNFEALRGRYGI